MLDNNVNLEYTHADPIFICKILNDRQIKHGQTHGKHTMRSTSTQKLILRWNTIFEAHVKHTVTLPEVSLLGHPRYVVLGTFVFLHRSVEIHPVDNLVKWRAKSSVGTLYEHQLISPLPTHIYCYAFHEGTWMNTLMRTTHRQSLVFWCYNSVNTNCSLMAPVDIVMAPNYNDVESVC